VRYSILFGFVVYLITSTAIAGSLVCMPKDNPQYWVRKLTIDTSSRSVSLDITKLRTARSTTLDTMSAVIERMDERQFGEPIYVFNAYPTSTVEVTHVFKLFKVFDKWRLISAGLVYVGKQPTLRAVDSGSYFTCTDGG
jgi:hypothetical protein